MALDQFVRIDDQVSSHVGFYYEGIPAANVTLGVITLKFAGYIDISQTTIEADAGADAPAICYFTIDDYIFATGSFIGGGFDGVHEKVGQVVKDQAYDTVFSFAAGSVLRLIAPSPANGTLSGIRSTIYVTKRGDA